MYEFILGVGEMPEWFSHRGEGSSLSFHVPMAVAGGDEFQALVVWVVCTVKEYSEREVIYASINAIMKNKKSGFQLFESWKRFAFKAYPTQKYYSWVKHVTLAELPCHFEEELELSVELDVYDDCRLTKENDADNIIVEKCGLHLIAKKAGIVKSDGSHGSVVIQPYHPAAPSTDDERWKSYLIRELPECEISFAGRG